MDRDTFTRAVAERLDLAGMPYDDGDLRQYPANVWHRPRIDLDADHWARRYAGTLGLSRALAALGRTR